MLTIIALDYTATRTEIETSQIQGIAKGKCRITQILPLIKQASSVVVHVTHHLKTTPYLAQAKLKQMWRQMKD